MDDGSDRVFRALADPTRRLLLDRLHERDGRTLLDLQTSLPMTRFGVMKHLKILEEAGLVVTRKVGREKFHHLNPVPIQELYDRWVSKYARDWARALTGLKWALEDESMSTTVATTSVLLEVYINTSPERLWQALTDGSITKLYYFGTSAESDWHAGSSYRNVNADGGVMIEGTILESDPPRLLKQTFNPVWLPEEQRGPETTVTWEITQLGNACKLRVHHEGLDAASPMAESVRGGWSQILSGLKTYLETGSVLELPPM
jgi:uncharacterized protein YndB with AHSA1/START domain/DNA-binding transcriptional ArsR family regulator